MTVAPAINNLYLSNLHNLVTKGSISIHLRDVPFTHDLNHEILLSHSPVDESCFTRIDHWSCIRLNALWILNSRYLCDSGY